MERVGASGDNNISFDGLPAKAWRAQVLKTRWLVMGAIGLGMGAGSPTGAGQRVPASALNLTANLSAESPRDWAVAVVANELVALHHPASYLRYRMRVIDAKGDKVRDIIESKDGAVARMILKNGKPLTEDEDRAERQRLSAMIESPSAFARHIKNDGEGKKLADELIRLMPDAMIYSYTPGQPQAGANGGSREIVLDYKPDPKFSPPNTTAEALTGIEGRLWIDAKSRELVRMEGTVFRPVNFGWGMLAHIYPGGHLVLTQGNAGGSRWIFTRFTEEVSVRALMVKTMDIHTDVEAGSFQTLPGPIGYQDAIRMLLNTPLPTG